jgi:hypothetical protein
MQAKPVHPRRGPVDSFVASRSQPSRGRKHHDVDAVAITADVLDYGDDAQSVSPTKKSHLVAQVSAASISHHKPSFPVARSTPLTSTSSVSSSLDRSPTKPDINADHAARTALLETRRKALESMKRKRKNAMATQADGMDIDSPPASASGATTPAIAIEEKSIEEQVAELEKEVLSLQTAVPIELDEPEEGEIAESPPEPIFPLVPVLMPPSSSSSLPPSNSIRGIKRPNAEDMENRPTSLPSRMPVLKRRSVFGGIPQRPNRLILHLDDDSSDEEDSDRRFTPIASGSGSVTPVPIPIPQPDDAERERLLKEKEEGIRRLREQIAAKMKAREMRLKQGSTEGSVTPSDGKGIISAAANVMAQRKSAFLKVNHLVTAASKSRGSPCFRHRVRCRGHGSRSSSP